MLEWKIEEVPCNITNMFDNLSLHLIIINRSSKIVEFKIYFAVALKRKIFSDDGALDPKGIFLNMLLCLIMVIVAGWKVGAMMFVIATSNQ